MSDGTTGSVPADARYGQQTRLALSNFPPGDRRLRDVPEFVRAYAQVKAACARANMDLGVLDGRRGDAIVRAAGSVADLQHLAEFPVALVQGGGGTSTNMNMNEVIASLANDRVTRIGTSDDRDSLVSPHDHVNASQSTNDTYPTAMAVALMDVAEPALAALERLRQTLTEQADRGRGVDRLGRTCLQDAVTLTVEQTHDAQATIVARSARALRTAIADLQTVPLGGTVLGTGVGAPAGFAPAAVKWLSDLSGRPLDLPDNVFASMAHLDAYASVASACSRAAIGLARVASDLRLLAAGPVGSHREVRLPELQDGSSIMRGKFNPIIPELVMQLSYRVRGAASTVDIAVSAGELELNVMEPVILDALLTCFRDIRDAATYFVERCVDGLAWDREILAQTLDGALDHQIQQSLPPAGDTNSPGVRNVAGKAT